MVITCLMDRPRPVMEWRISPTTVAQLKGLRLVLNNMVALGKDLRVADTDPTDINRHESWLLSLGFSDTQLAEEWAKGIMLHSTALLEGNNQSKIQPARPMGPRCGFCGHAATMASPIQHRGSGSTLTLCTACRWLWHKYPQGLHERKSISNQLIGFAKNHSWHKLKAGLKEMPSFINYKPPYRNYYILHHIAYFGAMDMVRWLKTYLPNVDWMVTTNDGQTPSQVAGKRHKHTAALLLKLEQGAENAGANTAIATAVVVPRVEEIRGMFERIGVANSDETDADREQPVACSICFATTDRHKKSNSCTLCHSITCSRYMIQVNALNLEYHAWIPGTPPPADCHICIRCYNKTWWLNRPPNGADISVTRVQKGVLPGWFRVHFLWQRWDRAEWVMAVPKFTVLELMRRMEIERVSKVQQLIRRHSRPAPESSLMSPMVSPLKESVLNPNDKAAQPGLQRQLSSVSATEQLVRDVMNLCLSPQCADLCRRFIPVPPVWDKKEEVFKGNATVKVPETEARFIDLLAEFLASEQVWICQLHCVLYRLKQHVHHENSTVERRTLWFLAAMTDAVQIILKEHRRLQRWMHAELTQMRSRQTRQSARCPITRKMLMQVSA